MCTVEFVPGVAVCSDCHVALVEPMPEASIVFAGDDAVVIESTTDAAVARGWRDVLTAAGVAHRIEVAREAGLQTTYTLLAGEADMDWASALADVVYEQPSIDAGNAVRVARARVDAEPVYVSDIDAAMFDVPDLLPPADVTERASALGGIAFGWSVAAFVSFALAVTISPWWWLLCVVSVLEAVKANRRARAVVPTWARENGG